MDVGFLRAGSAGAFHRGGVLVTVIIAEDDPELSPELGLHRTVEVFPWPEA
jgi:hypothetical protein